MAWNRATIALYGDLGAIPEDERFLVLLMNSPIGARFQNMVIDATHHAERLVAEFRFLVTNGYEDPRLGALYDKLCRSETFCRRWGRNMSDVREKTIIRKNVLDSEGFVLQFDQITTPILDNGVRFFMSVLRPRTPETDKRLRLLVREWEHLNPQAH